MGFQVWNPNKNIKHVKEKKGLFYSFPIWSYKRQFQLSSRNLVCCSTRVSSIQINCSVMSDSLQPHGLQHVSLPCPSPIPGVCSNSCLSSRWCHPTISFSAIPLSLPWNFPSIRGFSNESILRIRWPKYWSFIFSISPSNEYSGLISFRIDWFDYKDHKGHWYIKINEVLKKETKALNVNKTLKLKLLLYLDSTGLVSSSWKSPRKKTSHPLLK